MRPLALAGLTRLAARTALAGLAGLALLLAVAPARADGVITISWNGCTGPIDLDTNGGSTVGAFVSVLGQSQTAQSYQCVTIGGTPGTAMHDAWRFDPGGCEAGRFTLDHLAPTTVAKACPSFQGALPSLQIKDYAFNAATGKVKITLANAYPNGGAGNAAATNPTQRYFLAGYEFDLASAVVGAGDPGLGTCGGMESAVCWGISSASWLDTSGNEIFWTHGSDYLTVNDPNNSRTYCPYGPDLVPARARTWGAVKSQYRQ